MMYEDQDEHEPPEPSSAPAWAGVLILAAILGVICFAIQWL